MADRAPINGVLLHWTGTATDLWLCIIMVTAQLQREALSLSLLPGSAEWDLWEQTERQY